MRNLCENLNKFVHFQLRRTLSENPPLPGVYKARRGDFCVGLFTADNDWYRARIEKIELPDRIHVVYIDYGNVSK